jgi:hypothetical protein
MKPCHFSVGECERPRGVCVKCKRPLCAWHEALEPVLVDGRLELLPVCHPRCEGVTR